MVGVILKDWDDEVFADACKSPGGDDSGLWAWTVLGLRFCRFLLEVAGSCRWPVSSAAVSLWGWFLVLFGEWRVVWGGYRRLGVVGWWFS